MPFIITQDMFNRKIGTVSSVNYPYRYPLGLNLKPGTPLHDKLVGDILALAQESRSAMSTRFASWQALDKKLTAYIDLTAEEEDLERIDTNKPLSIVVPTMYASLETLLTYMVAAFLEEPILKYDWIDDRDRVGTALLELVVAQQCRKAKLGMHLHTMFRDMLVYGFGAVAPSWQRTLGYRTRPDKSLTGYLGALLGASRKTRTEEVVFEGNVFRNIDPYTYFPDVNHPITDMQHSDYQGWLVPENYSTLIDRERTDSGFFNGQYVQHIDGRSVFGYDQSERDRYDVSPFTNTVFSQRVDTLFLYRNVIPRDLNIGSRRTPEKWLFGVSGDSVLICARPAEFDHGMYPLAVCASEFDGYTTSPISRMELSFGLQKYIDYLFNSHAVNIRKALNDMFVVDPQRINLNDVLNPSAGGVIRTRKQAWGTGIKDSIQQLQVTDVTAANLQEALGLGSFLDMAMGTQDIVKGVQRKNSADVSATEYQGTRGAALSRLERMATVVGAQAIHDLAYICAYHTQQFMSTEAYVRFGGRYEDVLRGEYGEAGGTLVGPLDLLINFDVAPTDGRLPNSGDPALWAAMFQAIGANPLLAQQFDMTRMFKHWARLAGARNIDEFIARPQQAMRVLPDETVERGVEAGNFVPMEEAANATAAV